MSYEKFERSTQPSSFDEYENMESFIAWIDLLGVRRLSHEKLKGIIDTALDTAAEASSVGPIFQDGVLVGTPQSAFQYSIVGDAIVIVPKNQPKTPAAAQLAMIWRTAVLSRLLFKNGLIHRGAITRGPMKALVSEGNQIITGTGVVRAVGLESSIKATGLYYDKECLPFFKERNSQMIKKVSLVEKKKFSCFQWRSSARYMVGVMVDIEDGLDTWEHALSQAQKHKYVSRSKKIISTLKSL